ncbi:MAG: hypothetical protein ABL879_04960 [Devosia sp.]
MNATDQLWLLAFVITPTVVVAGAYLMVLQFERSVRRHRKHPAE